MSTLRLKVFSEIKIILRDCTMPRYSNYVDIVDKEGEPYVLSDQSGQNMHE
jgi:hypothetical protein